jgi:hypothetical protein
MQKYMKNKNLKGTYVQNAYTTANLVYSNYESVLVFIEKKSFSTSSVNQDNGS